MEACVQIPSIIQTIASPYKNATYNPNCLLIHQTRLLFIFQNLWKLVKIFVKEKKKFYNENLWKLLICIFKPVYEFLPSFGNSAASPSLEDRKYGYFWIFPHHLGENIQKYFEFLDTFGYSPILSEQLSDVLGGRSPRLNF